MTSTTSACRAVALALILASVTFSLAATPVQDHPFPEPDRHFTLGEFLRTIAAPFCLNMNLIVKGAVPREKRLDYTFRGMSCREALDLVISAEELKLVEFRPGIYFITPAAERAPSGSLSQRVFQLTHSTADKVIALIRANKRLAAEIDVDGLSVGSDPHTLIAYDSAEGLAAVSRALGTLDGASIRHPSFIPVSFLDGPELLAALKAFGPEPLAGLDTKDVVYVPQRRGVLVDGTPDQVQALKALIAQIDVAPETVTLGISNPSRTSETASRTGIDATQPIVITPGASNRIGGQVVYDRTRTSSAQSGVLWVTTLSGSPARIGIEQIFTIPIVSTTTTGAGTAQTSRTPQEVPVGLSLEVLPRVAGPIVLVDVSLTDSSPTAVTDIGVNRSQRALITKAAVRRGGSITIGGMATALRDSGNPGALGLVRAHSSRTTDLDIILFVR